MTNQEIYELMLRNARLRADLNVRSVGINPSDPAQVSPELNTLLDAGIALGVQSALQVLAEIGALRGLSEPPE